MELDELKKELQNYKDARDKAIKNREDFGWINEIIAKLEQEISELEPAAGADPEVLVSEEQLIENIELPTDYNLIFGDPRANGEIKILIRQVVKQMEFDHAAVLEQIYESQKQKIVELQEDHEIAINKIVAEKLEAESKRDNAIELKEAAEAEARKLVLANKGLGEQIDELESMVQAYKKPVAIHGLSLTTTLKPETDDEKQARLAKEKVDLINQNLSRFNIEPLPTKEELVTSKQLDDSFRPMAENPAVASDEPRGEGVSTAAAALEPAEDGASKLALEQNLYADVDRLKEQMRIVFDRFDLY